MVNLHATVAGKIARVNPNQPISVQLSQGYTTNAAGGRTPAYSGPISVMAQVQDLAQRDLRQLEGLNVQGSQRTLYVNGKLDGVVRFSQQGGDIIVIQDGTVWLTTAVLEQWPDWVKISMTLQTDSALTQQAQQTAQQSGFIIGLDLSGGPIGNPMGI